MTEPSDPRIDSAIRYALNHSPIREVQCDESGEYEVEIFEPECVKDFVMAVMRDLGVVT